MSVVFVYRLLFALKFVCLCQCSVSLCSFVTFSRLSFSLLFRFLFVSSSAIFVMPSRLQYCLSVASRFFSITFLPLFSVLSSFLLSSYLLLSKFMTHTVYLCPLPLPPSLLLTRSASSCFLVYGNEEENSFAGT